MGGKTIAVAAQCLAGALTQPGDLAANPRDVIFQCRDAGSKAAGEPARRPETVKEGLAQRLGTPPDFVGDTGMKRRVSNGVGQASANSGGEAHRCHVVGWRDGIRPAVLRDERQVSTVHVGVADQGAE